MNLGNANIVLRPRNVPESLDLTLLFLRRLGGRRYLALLAWVLTPALALCALVRYWLELDWADTWLLAVPLGIWLQGVFTLAAGEMMFSDALSLRGVLSRFGSRWIAYGWALLVSRALVAFLGFTVVLWPWAWSRYAYLPEALLLEGLPILRAAERAGRIGGDFVSRSGLLLAMVGCSAALIVGAQVLGSGIVQDVLQIELPWGDLWQDGGSLFALGGWFLAVPLLSTLRFLRYIDSRTRSDAWDVQVRLQHAAQVAAEAA